MTKKSRRSRLKYKKRSSPKPLAVKEAGQSPQVLPPSPKQAPVAKSTATAVEQATLHLNLLPEIKRSLTIGAVLLVLLIVLYFLLR
jgi:hypothetical protein